MHLEAGFPNPLLSNWYLASILKGLKRLKGDSTRQKLPITCHILQGILRVLDLSCPFDITFWAACLVGFFSFFRKSNLLIPSTEKFDPQKHLCRADVQFHPSGVILLVRWSKMIQFRQRTVQIPLLHIAKSPFCPSSALLICFRMVPTAVGHSPLFCYPSPTGVKPITHAAFTSYLRQCLKKLGIDPSLYSGHSFRRGGTNFALQCGLPADLIELQGDWSSNAYQRYIDPSLSLRQQVASTLGRSFHTFLSQSQNWERAGLLRFNNCLYILCSFMYFVNIHIIQIGAYYVAGHSFKNYTYLGWDLEIITIMIFCQCNNNIDLCYAFQAGCYCLTFVCIIQIYICHVRFSFALNGLHFPNPVLNSYYTSPFPFDHKVRELICTPAGRASDIKMTPAWSFQLSCLGLDALSLAGPTGVQVLDFCCSSVSELVLLLCARLVSSQWWLNLYVRCFHALMSRSPSRGPNNLYVYEPQQNLGRGLLQRETGLSTPPPQVIY